MHKKVFFLNHMQARQNVADFAFSAPTGCKVEFSEPSRKLAQNAKYHPMIHDIADQYHFLNRKWDDESMKRLLVDAFSEEMKSKGTPLEQKNEVVLSLDGNRLVQLGLQTKNFSVREASDFIEYLYAFGAQNGILFKGGAF